MILRHGNSKAVLEFFGLHYFRSETNKACRTKCLSRSKAVWESPRFTDKPVSKSQPYLSYLWLSLLQALICNPEGETPPGLFKGANEGHNVLRLQQNCVIALCSTQGLSDPPNLVAGEWPNQPDCPVPFQWKAKCPGVSRVPGKPWQLVSYRLINRGLSKVSRSYSGGLFLRGALFLILHETGIKPRNHINHVISHG